MSDPARNALLRNPVTPTVLKGPEKTNVIPQEASFELDIRLLPDEDTTGFRRELERIIADSTSRLESIGDMAPPYDAPLETELFRALERVAGGCCPAPRWPRPRARAPRTGPTVGGGSDLLWSRPVARRVRGAQAVGARERRAGAAGEHRVRAGPTSRRCWRCSGSTPSQSPTSSRAQ